MMEPGVHAGLSRSDLPLGLSPSGAKTLLFETPAKYMWQRHNPKPPTRAMVIGTLLHKLVLESECRYLVCADGRTKQGREDSARCREEGIEPVTAKEAAQIEGMAKAVLEHGLAAAILEEGEPEQAVIWTDEPTGITCRGFIDWLRPNAIVDLKSAADASPIGFGKAAANLAYDLQSWMYRDGIRQVLGTDLPFLHIAVESHEPYLVAVHQLPAEADERGERLTREALDLFAHCTETGIWPDYGTDIIPTPWPRWAA